MPTATATSVTNTLEAHKVCIHSVCFKETLAKPTDMPGLSGVYVPKSVLRDLGNPERITITISPA